MSKSCCFIYNRVSIFYLNDNFCLFPLSYHVHLPSLEKYFSTLYIVFYNSCRRPSKLKPIYLTPQGFPGVGYRPKLSSLSLIRTSLQAHYHQPVILGHSYANSPVQGSIPQYSGASRSGLIWGGID